MLWSGCVVALIPARCRRAARLAPARKTARAGRESRAGIRAVARGPARSGQPIILRKPIRYLQVYQNPLGFCPGQERLTIAEVARAGCALA